MLIRNAAYVYGRYPANPWEEDEDGWVEVWDKDLRKLVEIRAEDIDPDIHADPDDPRDE